MEFAQYSLDEFSSVLGSSAPVPGGGGASALAAGLGIALASMVVNLSIGKPRYAKYEKEFQEYQQKLEAARKRCLELIDADARGYEPVAAAYRVSKDDPNRDDIMEKALVGACDVPMEILEIAVVGIEAGDRLSTIGNHLALSDAAAAALFCSCALQSAALTIYINTQSMEDRFLARSIDEKTKAALDEYLPKAQAVYDKASHLLHPGHS